MTGISFLTKEKRQYMLVTTNDSRLRLMSMDTFGTVKKFKGHINRKMQLKASLSSDRKYIACGSDNGRVYGWWVECDVDTSGERTATWRRRRWRPTRFRTSIPSRAFPAVWRTSPCRR